MKKALKALTLFLTVCVILCFAACGDEEETSKTSDISSADASQTSKEASGEGSGEASKEESGAVSSEEPVSGEESSGSGETSGEESGDPGLQVADFVSQYVSFGSLIDDPSEPLMKARSTDATSVRLTGVNKGAEDGVAGVLAFNFGYEGDTIESENGTYDDYAVYVFAYNPETFHYEMTKSYKAEDAGKDSVRIPEDGFVLAIHSYFGDYIKAVDGVEKGHAFFPHGFRGTDLLDAEIQKKTAVLDGKVSESEYGAAVWDIEPDSGVANFGQFDKDDYYSTAKAYFCYDDEFLYVGVVVTSPYHVNPLTQDDASGMWQYECIQVCVSSVSPRGDYMVENWDDTVSHKAVESGIIRQYGFAVNEEGDSIHYIWIPSEASFAGETVCVRDDDAQTTVYEAKIPWSEIGGEGYRVDVKKGTELGVSVSVNSGNGTFKNILLRDGGGIIGLYDWTKLPVFTLG